MLEGYNVLKGRGNSLLKEKGSKFYGYAVISASKEEFQNYLSEIKKEHPKARHWCWAIRIDPESLLEKNSDDGEPSGSAGLPILNAMRSANVFNAGIVVVRYFGGTLLGVRGLIDAYGGASKMAIESAGVEMKTPNTRVEVQFPYELMSVFQQTLHKSDIEIVKEVFSEDCLFTLDIPTHKHVETIDLLKKIYGLKLSLIQKVERQD